MEAYLNYCWDNSVGATLISETSMNDTFPFYALGSAKDQIHLSWLMPLGSLSLYKGKYLPIMQLWAVL